MNTATALDIKMTKYTFEYGASKYFRDNAKCAHVFVRREEGPDWR